MEEIKKISSYSNIYSIDDIWKKINEKKSVIYKNTNISLSNDEITIYVNDNTIMNSLLDYKEHILENIKKELPLISKLNIKYTKEKIKKVSELKEEIKYNNNNIEIYENKKIYEEILKKYENIEDENIKNIYVAYSAQAEIKKRKLKKQNAKKCLICNEYFIPVENEKECILCVNRKQKKQIEYIKSKIYEDKLLTKEYAKKIYKIDESFFEKARNEILDEIIKRIYLKINESIKVENKDEIYLDDEIELYAGYYTNSDDIEVINLFKNKARERLKNNIMKIYQKEIKIY